MREFTLRAGRGQVRLFMIVRPTSATVLLVPGAFHGAWCFDLVVEGLRAEGVDARAIDLPGREPGVKASDLHGDAERVTGELDRIGREVVLVGHSYSGAVITEAGVHPAVRHLVYVAAFALADSESCMNAAAAEADAVGIDHSGRPDMGGGLIFEDNGFVRIDQATAAECFYNDCDAEITRWALGQLGPQPAAALNQVPSAIAWEHKPSTYVVCTNDQATHPDLQRILAGRCDESVAMPSGHVPFLSRPEDMVGILSELARRATKAN